MVEGLETKGWAEIRGGTMSMRTEMHGKALNGILIIDKVDCGSLMGLMLLKLLHPAWSIYFPFWY